MKYGVIAVALLMLAGCKRPSEAEYIKAHGCAFRLRVEAWGGGDLVYTQRLGEISTDGHEGWSVWDCPNHASVDLDDSKTPPELWAPQKAYMDARKQSR